VEVYPREGGGELETQVRGAAGGVGWLPRKDRKIRAKQYKGKIRDRGRPERESRRGEGNIRNLSRWRREVTQGEAQVEREKVQLGGRINNRRK